MTATFPRIVDTIMGRTGTVLEADPSGVSVMWKPGYVKFMSADKVDSGRYTMVKVVR